MLVELGLAEKILIIFLIVGHTHCSVDQYFSILTRAVKACRFIGSMKALWHLYQYAHKIENRRPSVNRAIMASYDYTTMLEPYLNAPMYFTIPHVFVLRSKFTKCILQYSLFSSFSLLPQEPLLRSGLIILQHTYTHPTD